MVEKKRARKFLSEPLLWVGAAMIGVVLMGPKAADLAKSVVGGNRDRGNVDEHGEAIVGDGSISDGQPETNLPSTQSEQVKPLAGVKSLMPVPGEDLEKSNASVTDLKQSGQYSAIQSNIDPKSKSRAAMTEGADRLPLNRLPSEKQSGGEVSMQDSKHEIFDVDAMLEEIRGGPSDDSTIEPLPMVSSTTSSDGQDDVPIANDSSRKIEAAEQDPKTNRRSKTNEKTRNGVASDSRATVGGDQNAKSRETLAGDVPERSEPAERNRSNGGQGRPASDDNTRKPYSLADDEDGSSFNIFEGGRSRNGDDGNDDDAWSSKNRDVNKLPDFDSPHMPSVARETGDAWWAASVTQQFWPQRQAQFADLDAVVFAALHNAPSVQILNQQPQIQQTFVDQSRAEFDWSTFVDARWNSVNEPVRSLLQTGTPGGRFAEESLEVGHGVRKNLARGGQLQIASTFGTVDNNSLFLDPQDQGLSSFSLDYRQPLLRGRGREVAQSQIVLAKIGVEVQDELARQQVRDYLVDVVSAYWDLYRARGVLAQRNRSMIRARDVLDRLSTVRSSDRGFPQQLNRAKAVISARHSDLVDAEYAVANAQEHLMNLTHGSDMADPNQVELIPTELPSQLGVSHDLESVTSLAIRFRPEVKAAFAEIKAASLRQTVAFNDLKPRLDAIISSYVLGVDGNKDVGQAFSNQFTAGDPSYSVGVAFEVPIGRRAANAQVHRRELEQQLLQNKLKKTLGDVTVSARIAWRDIQRLLTVVEKNQIAAQNAATVLNGIEGQRDLLLKRDQSASLHLNDLLLAQQQLAVTEQALLDSQAELAMSYVRLKYATGELLQESTSVCDADCVEGDCQICSASQSPRSATTQPTGVQQVVFEQPVEPAATFNREPSGIATSASPTARYPLSGVSSRPSMSGVQSEPIASPSPPVEPGNNRGSNRVTEKLRSKLKPAWNRLLRK